MNRSALNSIRSSIGMGQGNIRNENTRSNDMQNYSNSGQVQFQNPGMQQSPYPTIRPPAPMPQFNENSQFGGGGYGGMQQYDKPMQENFGGAPAGQAYKPPQTNAPPGGLQAQMGMGGGQVQPSAYGQQLNRFVSRGGQFNQFKPRMGAMGPQYRNGVQPQQQQQPPMAPPPPDGNIGLPPQPDPTLSYVKPTFAGGF